MTPREKLQKHIAGQQDLIDTATRAIQTFEEQMSELPLDLFVVTNEQADDAAFEMLVAASSEKSAKQIAHKRGLRGWPKNRRDVSCQRVGVSTQGVKPHVLMDNYLQEGKIVG